MKHQGNELIQRLLADDPEAAKQFFAHYSPLVKSKALAAGFLMEDAEEISQETLIRVLQNIRAKQGLNEPRKLSAFVHGTAKRVIAEFRRDRLKHFRMQGAAGSAKNTPARSSVGSPERRLWNDEFQQQCDRVLTLLRPRYREFLSDHYIQGLDAKALCRKWKITSGHCRVLHHRALKAFARQAERRGVLDELLAMMQNKPD